MVQTHSSLPSSPSAGPGTGQRAGQPPRVGVSPDQRQREHFPWDGCAFLSLCHLLQKPPAPCGVACVAEKLSCTFYCT